MASGAARKPAFGLPETFQIAKIKPLIWPKSWGWGWSPLVFSVKSIIADAAAPNHPQDLKRVFKVFIFLKLEAADPSRLDGQGISGVQRGAPQEIFAAAGFGMDTAWRGRNKPVRGSCEGVGIKPWVQYAELLLKQLNSCFLSIDFLRCLRTFCSYCFPEYPLWTQLARGLNLAAYSSALLKMFCIFHKVFTLRSTS